MGQGNMWGREIDGAGEHVRQGNIWGRKIDGAGEHVMQGDHLRQGNMWGRGTCDLGGSCQAGGTYRVGGTCEVWGACELEQTYAAERTCEAKERIRQGIYIPSPAGPVYIPPSLQGSRIMQSVQSRLTDNPDFHGQFRKHAQIWNIQPQRAALKAASCSVSATHLLVFTKNHLHTKINYLTIKQEHIIHWSQITYFNY